MAHIESRFNALAQACHSSAASAPQLTYTLSLQSIDHSHVRRSFCAPGAPLLAGYRGHSAADVPALVEMALACTRYAQAHVDRLVELDINPVTYDPQG